MPVDLREGTASALRLVTARVVADSITEAGVRLLTMVVVMHRFVLAEFNTHRVFSRNSASSRAIPVLRQLERIRANRVMPIFWPREQPGMQGGAALTGRALDEAIALWQGVCDGAYASVEEYVESHPDPSTRLHKSVVNRLLEPQMLQEVIVTSTAWDNFFGLRLDEAAQPEIRAAAVAMREAYDASTPTLVRAPLWHLPFIDREDITAAEEHLGKEASTSRVTAVLVKTSAARCARVSYLTHDGERAISVDLGLYGKLTASDPMHASALEHPATPDSGNSRREVGSIMTVLGDPVHYDMTLPRYGNFLGWRQLRFEVEAEKAVASYA